MIVVFVWKNQDDCYPLGDVNFDEVLNILDITSLVFAIVNEQDLR